MKLTNKQKKDLRSIAFFMVESQFIGDVPKVTADNVASYFNKSDNGIEDDKFSDDGTKAIMVAKQWRDRHLSEIWVPAILDGAGIMSVFEDYLPEEVADMLINKYAVDDEDKSRLKKVYECSDGHYGKKRYEEKLAHKFPEVYELCRQ